MNKIIEGNYQAIEEVLRRHKVQRLEVFGSITNESFNSMSDIDLLVVFDEIPIDKFADNYFSLEEELQNIFDRSVDILILKDVKNKYFLSSISKQRKVIYEHGQSNV